MRIILQDLDPFPDLEKTKHLFKDGDRVDVVDGPHVGRSGKIKAILHTGDCLVRLDSGHEATYRQRELAPENFYGSRPKVAFSAPHHFDADEIAVAKASHDPIPVPDSPAQTRPLTRADANDPLPIDVFTETAQSDLVGDFLKAADAGAVSQSDLVSAREECSAIASDAQHSHRRLIGILKRYSASDVLQKRMRPNLKTGMKVRMFGGKLGTIRAIIGDMVKIVFDDGSGEGTALLNSTMEVLSEA